MPRADIWGMIALGLVFLVVGILAFFLGRKEETDYYQAISSHGDVREYIEHTPERPEPGGLRVGGIISSIIGLILLIISLALVIWG